jgi:spore maturation protein SpmB
MLEISPDFFGGGVEVTPSGIFLPGKLTDTPTSVPMTKTVSGSYSLAMTRDIARAARVAVFQPSPADIMIFLIDLKLNILEQTFGFVCYL